MNMRTLIVGLGNPGNQYEYTVHNIGALIVSRYVEKNNLVKNKDYFYNQNNNNILYSFSLNYMNIAGINILKLIKYNNVKKLIVLYDDIRVNVGKYKICFGGSHSGHNGIKTIIDNYNNDFYRVKIGVGPKPIEKDLSDFVLSKFSGDVLEKILINEEDIWSNITKIL